MKKILAKTEEDYFQLYLENHTSDSGDLYEELIEIEEKFKKEQQPIEYPCIIVYHHYIYFFIYQNDFVNFKPLDTKKMRKEKKLNARITE